MNGFVDEAERVDLRHERVVGHEITGDPDVVVEEGARRSEHGGQEPTQETVRR